MKNENQKKKKFVKKKKQFFDTFYVPPKNIGPF